MRTVDPEKHRQRRRQIIEAATTLFATKGLAKTTTAEICRAAGMSSGNLFHYFPSKQAIFYAMFELDREEWDAALKAALADPDPWAALMRVVDRIAAEAAHPLMPGLIVEVLAQAHRDPELARLVAESDRRLFEGIAALVERMRDEGLADPGLAPEEAARWVVIITDGFHTRGYAEPDRDRAAEVAVAKELIARILRYTGPQTPEG
ncbi:TetR/AcrR family transcriptional regulator [Thermomonospora catenispora]|uniref:TetR/AcrR family transcriptional regulator n=1 Tax=Thermomonospora catenispora TaxID=2493090 RepID=UPI0013754694|nr:TetR/AcrR family transcriptional regulator [Thermomonospora catenispora]